MGDRSAIEWTQATWNPVTGCTKVSPGCKNCYAERDWNRLSKNSRANTYFGREFSDVQCHAERLDQPLRWSKPRNIFVNSMADLFHEAIPFEFIDQVFSTMARAKQHTFQVLTKRPEIMLKYMTTGPRPSSVSMGHVHWGWGESVWPLPNVWLGVSVEDRKYGLPRIEILKNVPARVRFLSVEPLLEELGDVDLQGIHWVIAGGESGPRARPMPLTAARSIRDQCMRSDVPFFFKQWGEWGPTDTVPNGVERIGRAQAGSLLDGRVWNEFPKIQLNEATK